MKVDPLESEIILSGTKNLSWREGAGVSLEFGLSQSEFNADNEQS